MSAALQLERLADALVRMRHDPLGFVEFAYPWGEGGLTGQPGPDQVQADLLGHIGEQLRRGVSPIKAGVASGHGIGKSTLISWAIQWGMATFPDCRGVVTSNTERQLKSKTWPEVDVWHQQSLVRPWFRKETTRYVSADRGREETWRLDMVPWSEKNPEAFAGLHNRGRRILLLFDEASAIPDVIWDTAEGALTDANTEIIWLAFGNPTRSTGRFRELFGSRRGSWYTMQVDSRRSRLTNKQQIQEWLEQYGEDSDFFRIRVRGEFPQQAFAQLIPHDVVAEARRRPAFAHADEPLIYGLDVGREGDDDSRLVRRKGRDARSLKGLKWHERDSMKLAAKVVDVLEQDAKVGLVPDAFFLDGGGIGGPVGDRLRQLGVQVIEVGFGDRAADERRYGNRATEMWCRMRDWLRSGGAIEDDPQLEQELVSRDYGMDKQDRLILESKRDMKSRGVGSPDWGDALALTFAEPVLRQTGGVQAQQQILTKRGDYQPLARR